MSSKNVEIPYNILAQGIQDINYPANTLYAQTMNAPAPITLDMYLNNHLVDNRVIQPNYELNLENIDINEVKVSMESNTNLNNIVLSSSFGFTNLYALNYNPNNNLIYGSVPSTPVTLGAINNLGSIVYSYTFPTGFHVITQYSQIVIDSFNNVYIIAISPSGNYYLFKFNSTLNLIKSVLVPSPFYYSILSIYNNSIYYIFSTDSNTLNINQYSFSLTLINSSQTSNNNLTPLLAQLTVYQNFIYNNVIYYFISYNDTGYIYAIDLNNINNSKIITFSLPIAFNGSSSSILIYNSNLDIAYLIYGTTDSTTIIFTIQGSDINNFSTSNYITLPIDIASGISGICDGNNNIWIFSSSGHSYMLTLSENTYAISKTFSVSRGNFYYISATVSNIIAINNIDAYFFYNPVSQNTINNSNYPNSFNMILGCGCP